MLPTAGFSNFLPLEVDCRRQGTIVAIIRFSAFLRRLWKVDLLTPLLLAIASVVTCAFASEVCRKQLCVVAGRTTVLIVTVLNIMV